MDPVYLESMRQPLTGLANISIKTIFGTLFAQHGKLTSNQITAATDMCKLPWDPAVPVQVVFNRIREAQDLVTRGENPFSDAQMLKFGYDTVLKTACFGDGLKAWSRKASADKTWANFQTYMVDEYDDYLEDQNAEVANPYAQANMVSDDTTLSTLTDIHDRIVSDRGTLSTLQQVNSVLSTENATLKEKVKNLETRMNTAFQKLGNIEEKLKSQGKDKQPGAPRTDQRHPQKNFSKYTRRPKYCFICGLQPWHEGKDCPLDHPLNKKEATAENMMGGNPKSQMILKDNKE